MENYNTKELVIGRLVYNLGLFLVIVFIGYLTMNPMVIFGLIFTCKITYESQWLEQPEEQ